MTELSGKRKGAARPDVFAVGEQELLSAGRAGLVKAGVDDHAAAWHQSAVSSANSPPGGSITRRPAARSTVGTMA
ncbi:MAG: hypothetical protein ABF254_14770, partial [Octadecabacter sp.]